MEFDNYWINKEGKKIRQGPHINLFESFQMSTGIRFQYIRPSPMIFGVMINGTYNGLLGLVQKGLADVTSREFYFTPERYEFADYTVPLHSSPFCIVVRRAPAIPFAKVLLLPYEHRAWGAILFTLVVVTITWNVTYRDCIICLDLTKLSVVALDHAIVDVIEVVLTGASRRHTPFLKQRLVLGALLLFVVVLSNAYQGRLLGFLTTPPRVREPQTLQETSKTIKRLHAFSLLHTVFESDDTSDVLRDLRQKMDFIKFKDIEEVLGEMINREDEGVMMGKADFRSFGRKEKLANGKLRLFHLVPECVNTPGALGFLIRKNSPVNKIFKTFIMRILEGGLFDHWRNELNYLMDINGVTIPELKSRLSDIPKPLGLKQQEGAFFVFIIGLSAAGVIFALELFIYRASCAVHQWFDGAPYLTYCGGSFMCKNCNCVFCGGPTM